jgi:hypothetical protein
VKREKDFKVATATWTSQSAKLYGIVKWLWVVWRCFWHPVISDSRTEIQGTTTTTAEAEHPKWGEKTSKVFFHLARTLLFSCVLGVQQLNSSIEYASHYCLNRIANKLNKDMLGTENAHSEYVSPHPVKCTVWCAATAVCILGPVSLRIARTLSDHHHHHQ